MSRGLAFFCAVTSLSFLFSEKGFSEAETDIKPQEQNQQAQIVKQAPFKPFSGKITKNKVRMRSAPNMEGAIVREVGRGDLFLVIGESDEFYAVSPPEGTKAFIFRTFVLDGVVEGSHVNVRLEPTVEAPSIAQLNSGDRVDGKICASNNRWLEITPPSSSKLYIAKEFVQNIGTPDVITAIKRRHNEVSQLMQTARDLSEQELLKSFEEMDLALVYKNLNKVIQDYTDFSDEIAQAKQLLANLEAVYLQKKVAYLESRPKIIEVPVEVKVVEVVEAPKENSESSTQTNSSIIAAALTLWNPVEETFYQKWASTKEDGSTTKEDFYKEQRENSITIRGKIDNYIKPVKNRPGDFMLVNGSNHLPLAYLYSTSINLQEFVGKEVTLEVAERPNNNFAFPAYFVFSVND